MNRLAVLFNTFTKLKAYDFDKLRKELNIDFVVVSTNNEVSRIESFFKKKFKKILVSSLIDINGTYKDIEPDLKTIISNYKLENIRFICLSEDYLSPVSVLREKFNICGINSTIAQFFRDKVIMKEKLKKNGITVPKFIDLAELSQDKSNEQIYSIIESSLGSPFVLKPKDAFGSKDVSIISSMDQFKEISWEINNFNDFEVESYISGKLYHIDSIYNNGNVIFQACCEDSTPNLNFRNGKPLLSIPLPEYSNEFKLGSSLSKEVINTFGYLTGSTHLEFFIDASGQVIFLEVAARTPGAIIVPMYKKHFGINMLELDLLNNFNITRENTIINSYVFSGIMPILKGKVTKLNTPNISGDFDINFIVKKGDVLQECNSLRDISATILVENKNFEAAYSDFKSLSNFKCINVDK